MRGRGWWRGWQLALLAFLVLMLPLAAVGYYHYDRHQRVLRLESFVAQGRGRIGFKIKRFTTGYRSIDYWLPTSFSTRHVTSIYIGEWRRDQCPISEIADLSSPSIESLKLWSGDLTSDDWRQIGRMKSLKSLSVEDPHLDAEAFDSLAGLHSLGSLALSSESVTYGKPWPPRIHCKLWRLDLSGSAFTDEVAKGIIGKMPLKIVTLANTEVTDAIIEVILGLPNLEEIDLGNADVSNEAAKLFSIPNVKRIYLDGTGIDREMLGLLEERRSFERVHLRNTNLNETDIDLLKSKFPEAEIFFTPRVVSDQHMVDLLMEKLSPRGAK